MDYTLIIAMLKKLYVVEVAKDPKHREFHSGQIQSVIEMLEREG